MISFGNFACNFPKVLNFREVLLVSLLLFSTFSTLAQRHNRSIPDINYEELVSRASLTYDKPVNRSEEGLPIGNGRMGSLVWTTP
jgi:hypothetical protein